MAVYRPKYRDPSTGEYVPTSNWWYEFIVAGKRIRESTKTSPKALALAIEKRRKQEYRRAAATAKLAEDDEANEFR